MRKQLERALTIGFVFTLSVLPIPGQMVVAAENEAAGPKGTSYIHLNKAVAKLERNALVTGIWVAAPHPSVARGLVELNAYPDYEESLTRPMIDFIVIAMEHKPFEMTELRNFLLALNSRRELLAKGNLQPNITALVRIPADGDQPVHAMIKQVLDVGAHGVVVPHVRTAQQAEKIVKACRYIQPKGSKIAEPVGTRGVAPGLAAYLWGVPIDEYFRRADVWPLNPRGDLLVVFMIEDQEAVRNIDEILSVKGVGAVMFGPLDYSFSCGRFGDADHPDVDEGFEKVRRACVRFNVPLIAFANRENIQKRLDEGHKMLLIGSDVGDHGDKKAIFDVIEKRK